jgi:glutaredoxin-related protein
VSQRPSLPAARVSPDASAKIAAFHADVVRDVELAVQRDPVVVVGMAQNPHVKNVRNALTEAKIAFTYLEYGSYFSEWKKRLAIKLWSGWATFPQVFVRGVLIGGEDLTKAAIADGSLATRLAAPAQAGVSAQVTSTGFA